MSTSWHFTPDGHIACGIGEAVPKHYNGMVLFSASYKDHVEQNNIWLIWIKAAQWCKN
jgi:hypothetical protein